MRLSYWYVQKLCRISEILGKDSEEWECIIDILAFLRRMDSRGGVVKSLDPVPQAAVEFLTGA